MQTKEKVNLSARAVRRYETQKHQREAIGKRFHPRSLARAIAHANAANSDVYGVNKVHPGQTQSAFAKNWRNIATRVAEQKYGKKVNKNKH